VTGAGDEESGAERVARCGVDGPETRGFFEFGADNLGAEADMGAKAEVGGAALDVVEDFGLRREEPGPVRVGREGEAVEVRRHIAGGARIGVLTPGSADPLRPLEDEDVGEASLTRLMGESDAGEARSDDNEVEGLGAGFVHGEGHRCLVEKMRRKGRSTAG